MAKDLLLRPATELRQLMVSGLLSPTQLMELTLDRIAERNRDLNAIVTLDAPAAITAAAVASRVRSDFGPLHGLPFTVKDSVEVAGVRTTAGSALLRDNIPRRHATVVERVIAAGAIFIGKTNCPEFGIGNLDTDNLLFGRSRNPHDQARTPGGSSGGESAAVAAGLSAFGIGTDYGGSVRWPAHCTGLAALRPTPGRLPSAGMLPHEPGDGPYPGRRSELQRQLQTIGFLTRSAADLAVLLDVAEDAPGGEDAPPPGAAPLAGVRCAWFTGAVDAEVSAAVAYAAELLATRGLTVELGEPTGFNRAAALLAELRAAEGSPEIATISQGRTGELTDLVRAELSRSAPAGGPQAAAELARDVAAVREQALRFLQDWPILLMPAGAIPAFIPEQTPGPRAALEEHNRAVTLLGLPAAVVPISRSLGGLPIGVQVAGAPGHDHLVLHVARILQAAAEGSPT